MWVRSLGWEDPLEEEMATHSSILAWRIPWIKEPGQLQSMGSQGWTQLSNWTHIQTERNQHSIISHTPVIESKPWRVTEQLNELPHCLKKKKKRMGTTFWWALPKSETLWMLTKLMVVIILQYIHIRSDQISRSVIHISNHYVGCKMRQGHNIVSRRRTRFGFGLAHFPA